MALVPFSYANPFTDQLKAKERLFTINARLLRVQQAWKGDGTGGTSIGFGASVYPAAYVLAEYLERHPYLVRGKRVIELGTGTGFLGIATAVLGAAEVCLTDGDDESLRLAWENVEANLMEATQKCRSSRRDHPVEGSCAGDEAKTNGSSPGVYAGGVSNARVTSDGCSGDVMADYPDGSPTKAVQQQRGITDVNIAKMNGGAPDAVRASAGGVVGDCHLCDCRVNDSVGGEGDGGQSLSPRTTVQKLRWGCSGDMEACYSDNGNWDVVLGSDIAALPYASAYGKLLQTIVSLVNSDRHPGQSLCPASGTCITCTGGGTTSTGASHGGGSSGLSSCAHSIASDRSAGKRKVVVLLAHKRRHLSEDKFFEDLKGELGGENCCEIGDEDLHPDFSGSGIRLHLFTVERR